MTQHYSNPTRESDPHALPDIETFYVSKRDWSSCPICDLANRGLGAAEDFAQHTEHVGWYWWPCSPGCLPDGDPNGPYDTEDEALADARAWMADEPEPCALCDFINGYRCPLHREGSTS